MLRGDARMQIGGQATKTALQPLASDPERSDKGGLLELEQSNHDATRRNMFCLQVGVGVVFTVLVVLSAVAVGMIGGLSSDLHALSKVTKQDAELGVALQQQVKNVEQITTATLQDEVMLLKQYLGTPSAGQSVLSKINGVFHQQSSFGDTLDTVNSAATSTQSSLSAISSNLDSVQSVTDSLSDVPTQIATLAAEIGSSNKPGATIFSTVAHIQSAVGTQDTTGTMAYDLNQLQLTLGDQNTDGTLVKNVNDLHGAVGDQNTDGTLVKNVKDITAAVGDQNTDGTLVKNVNDLTTTVGDDTKEGSVAKNVNDLTATVGDDTKEGSVAKNVKDITAAVGDQNTDGTLVKNVNDLTAAVGDQNTDGTLVKNVNDLTATVGDDTKEGSVAKNVKEITAAVGNDDNGLVKNVGGIQDALGEPFSKTVEGGVTTISFSSGVYQRLETVINSNILEKAIDRGYNELKTAIADGTSAMLTDLTAESMPALGQSVTATEKCLLTNIDVPLVTSGGTTTEPGFVKYLWPSSLTPLTTSCTSFATNCLLTSPDTFTQFAGSIARSMTVTGQWISTNPLQPSEIASLYLNPVGVFYQALFNYLVSNAQYKPESGTMQDLFSKQLVVPFCYTVDRTLPSDPSSCASPSSWSGSFQNSLAPQKLFIRQKYPIYFWFGATLSMLPTCLYNLIVPTPDDTTGKGITIANSLVLKGGVYASKAGAVTSNLVTGHYFINAFENQGFPPAPPTFNSDTSYNPAKIQMCSQMGGAHSDVTDFNYIELSPGSADTAPLPFECAIDWSEILSVTGYSTATTYTNGMTFDTVRTSATATSIRSLQVQLAVSKTYTQHYGTKDSYFSSYGWKTAANLDYTQEDNWRFVTSVSPVESTSVWSVIYGALENADATTKTKIVKSICQWANSIGQAADALTCDAATGVVFVAFSFPDASTLSTQFYGGSTVVPTPTANVDSYQRAYDDSGTNTYTGTMAYNPLADWPAPDFSETGADEEYWPMPTIAIGDYILQAPANYILKRSIEFEDSVVNAAADGVNPATYGSFIKLTVKSGNLALNVHGPTAGTLTAVTYLNAPTYKLTTDAGDAATAGIQSPSIPSNFYV